MSENGPSFIQMLFDKKAAVIKAQEESGKDLSPALIEVDRQILQAVRGGDPVKGATVTKSGEED
ncbi:MAG: hypothetical protein UZ22_OP11002000126 [Microgenomates bacterium OLB23]|nr:MAG: hypothetical protein UZ22_OP11002000126 [Microgenomates bacterium OLB23]